MERIIILQGWTIIEWTEKGLDNWSTLVMFLEEIICSNSSFYNILLSWLLQAAEGI